MNLHRRRQDEMVDQLEQAVAMSFGPLEAMFEKTEVDVDGLLAMVQRTHSGQGGPLGAATVSTRSFDDPELGARFDQLMLGLDRMNLMRIAVSKVPYALPIDGSYRFTSGFGAARPADARGHRPRRAAGHARSSPPPTAWSPTPGARAAMATSSACSTSSASRPSMRT